MSKSKSITPETTRKIAAGMYDPPGDPVIRVNSKSLLNTITGAMVLIGLLPNSNLLPGLAARPFIFLSPYLYAKLFIWLFIRIPVPGIVTPEPNEYPNV